MQQILDTLMQDTQIRKSFGSRVKQLRKQRDWTQKELAREIDASYQQLNKYESGIHTPPLDKIALLAEALNTNIDYLVLGDTTEAKPIHNKRLLQRFQLIESFDDKEQETVITLIDAMVAKHQMQTTLNTIGG